MIVSTLLVTAGALVHRRAGRRGRRGLSFGCRPPPRPGDRQAGRRGPGGIPSVVVGFLGIVLFGPLIARVFHLGNGLNALNGSLLLAIMALPTIISLSEDALNAVPSAYGEASLALGASRWQTLVRVQIPAALSGIIAAIMLGMGRAIGETMTVLMATGNARAFPHGLLASVRTMTANIAIELGEVPYYTTHYYALFGIGLVLFLMTFVVNMVADIILRKYQERDR